MSSGGEEIQWSLPVYGVAMFLGYLQLTLSYLHHDAFLSLTICLMECVLLCIIELLV